MRSAGIADVLLVETWSGANRGILEETLRSGSTDRFRIALCYREHDADSLRRLLAGGALACVRVST